MTRYLLALAIFALAFAFNRDDFSLAYGPWMVVEAVGVFVGLASLPFELVARKRLALKAAMLVLYGLSWFVWNDVAVGNWLVALVCWYGWACVTVDAFEVARRERVQPVVSVRRAA